MRPSTTTGVALRSFGNPLLNDYEETVRRLYDAGYRVLDFAFVCHNYPNYILREDDWQQRIDRIARRDIQERKNDNDNAQHNWDQHQQSF